MAENNKARSKKDGQEKEPRSLFLVFRRFEFKFPPIFNLSPKADVDAIKLEEKEKITGNKPADVVKFSDPKPLAPPPLKVEVEEPEIKHPLILLPVSTSLIVSSKTLLLIIIIIIYYCIYFALTKLFSLLDFVSF